MIQVPNSFRPALRPDALNSKQSERFSELNVAKALASKKTLSTQMTQQIQAIKAVIQKNIALLENSSQKQILIDKSSNAITVIADDKRFSVPFFGQVFTLEEMLETPGTSDAKVIARPSNPYYKSKNDDIPQEIQPLAKDQTNLDVDLSVFPNPSGEEFHIELSFPTNFDGVKFGSLEITTLNGQAVKTVPLNGKSITLSTRELELPKGSYLVQYTNGRTKTRGKTLFIK